MRRRRIWTALAILVPTVLALGVIAALLWAEEAKDRNDRHAVPGNWSLLGVRDDGRTLVVRGPAYGDCDRTSVTADESDPDRVVITSRVLEPRDGGVCTLVLHGGDEVELRLDRPIAGRAVTGERRKLQPARISEDEIDFDEYVDSDGLIRPLPVPDHAPPTVVGLRFRDARHALCNAGFEARRLSGSAPNGVVSAQRAPTVQPALRSSDLPSCANGMRPAVDLALR